MRLVEASLRGLADALAEGRVTSVGLVAGYLARIGHYDHHGIRLNAVPMLNPAAFDEARAADVRRARGQSRGPLDGIPFVAKDSYKVRGLPVASGSPAFADLIASEDAFSIARLREAGAVFVGLTTMPPMANGGMQRGVYGRAESPYNANFLTSAWASGSSNGSGTATAAGFAAFGLGEETWSSGRAPANNNGLCAYTPSWGVISMRGNWPLVPTMDVVVPHARSMDDLLTVLDAMVADDPEPRGDFWRVQPWLSIPPSSELRPASYAGLARPGALAGKRIGMPRMYLGRGPGAVETRPSVVALAEAAAEELRSLGAEVVETDFPVMAAYESSHAYLGGGYQGGLAESGYVPESFAEAELIDLAAFGLEDFLQANFAGHAAGHFGGPRTLAEVDPALVFPDPPGQLPDQSGDPYSMGEYVRFAAERGIHAPADIPGLGDGVLGLDRARRELLEDWLDAQGLDALAFPTSADVGPADADTEQDSHDLAWRNGTWVANGNLVIRHLGIPTVTVPMGILPDIGMPSGLTFAGRGWQDSELLAMAWEYDDSGSRRQAPPRTPELPSAAGEAAPADPLVAPPAIGLEARLLRDRPDSRIGLVVEGLLDAEGATEVLVTVNGDPVPVELDGTRFRAVTDLPGDIHNTPHSTWRAPYGSVVVAVARGPWGEAGTFRIVGGV